MRLALFAVLFTMAALLAHCSQSETSTGSTQTTGGGKTDAAGAGGDDTGSAGW